MRAERLARHQHRPVAVVGSAIDQHIIDIDGIFEQQLELVLVGVGPIEQLAPITVAIRELEDGIVVQPDRNVALRQRLAQQVGAAVVAEMRKMRRDLRSGRECQRSRPLPEACSFEHSGRAIELDWRLLHYRSTSPNTMSSEPRIAETSASRWPRQMKSIDCRCAKPGARILHL